MKRFGLLAAVVLGALLACANVSLAQDAKAPGKGKRGPQTVEQQLDRMDQQLNLTTDQKPKVKAVLEQFAKKRQEDLAGVRGQERREKMTALNKEQDEKLKAILTPAQMEKLEKMRERAKKGGQNKDGEPKGKAKAKGQQAQ